MNLRPYQQRIVDQVESGWADFDRQLVVCPTGGGKTIVFAHLAKRRADRNQRTLILAHREELIDQAIDKIRVTTGIEAAKEKAECYARRDVPVVVGSVQTFWRRSHQWPQAAFDLIVCDEAHHAISDTWQQVLGYFRSAQVLGVTATPDRGDKKNLGSYFQNVAAEVSMIDLIKDGYLSSITIQSVPLKIDLTKVRSINGDFVDSDLGAALEPYLDQIARELATHASFRRVLCFLPLIATSHKFVAACERAGLSACHVDGNSPDRRAILQRFSRWEFDVLSNAMLLTEGFDDPGIDCVVSLRPTKSRPLYAQMAGRGTRIAPGKANLLLLDFLWLHEKHRLVRPANLIARTDDEADAMTSVAQARANGGGNNELDLQTLQSEASHVMEERLRKRLADNRGKAGQTISAEEFALDHHQPELADWEPVMAWEREAVTKSQEWLLKRSKISLDSVKSKGHASQLISIIKKEERLVLASPKQRSLMARMGHPNADSATQAQAREFFKRLNRKNNK